MNSTKRIFISHSEKDKPLADALVDLLQTGVDVSQATIFCSSLEGLGIPDGLDFVQYISDKIAATESVIVLLTPNFFQSSFCLCELGATWAIQKRIHPILVPPLDYDDVKAVLAGLQLLRVNSAGDLDRLFDDLIAELEITTAATGRWNVKRDTFLSLCESIIPQLPQPQMVSREQHEELKTAYDESVCSLTDQQTRYAELERQIEDIKKLKDAEEVRQYNLEHSTELEEFSHYAGETKDLLAKVPNIVRYLIFRSTIDSENYGYLHATEDKEKHDAANSALEEGFLKHDGEVFEIERTDPTVKRILDSIEALEWFIGEKMSSDLYEQLVEENGFAIKLGNARFWREYLRLEDTFRA